MHTGTSHRRRSSRLSTTNRADPATTELSIDTRDGRDLRGSRALAPRATASPRARARARVRTRRLPSGRWPRKRLTVRSPQREPDVNDTTNSDAYDFVLPAVVGR